MSATFKGDFKKLEAWANLTEGAPKVLPVISKNLAEESISLIRDGMNRGIDPYGRKYKKLVLRRGQPLKRTGGMFAAWNRQRASAKGFKVSNAKEYSAYHQEGTGIYGPRGEPITPTRAKALAIPMPGGGTMFRRSVKGTPKRMMVPNGRLPKRWKKAYRETVNEVFSSHFRSR